ncbi:hypothetical protein Hanom_Chr03g00197301 [Helianthus anomalus]
MVGAMLQEANQRQLEVNECHNQAGFLSEPSVDQAELFGSLIRGLNNCPLTHALRANPGICSSCINTFWNTSKINRQEAGSIEATVQKTKIVVTEAVIREVLRLGDQLHYPTLFDQARVQAALRSMSYEGGYPTVLKKLFPPYWRLLLNKTQTSVVVALVNEWDYNFSVFIFDNMKKMLDDPKKKIFMLYPRFIQMIIDERYPTLVKGANYINLKPMGQDALRTHAETKEPSIITLKHDMLLRSMGGLLTLCKEHLSHQLLQSFLLLQFHLQSMHR